MENYLEVIETLKIFGRIFILSWFITRFEPLQWFINEFFSFHFNEKWKELNQVKEKFKFLLETLITCMKCTSFWLSLILTEDIYIAALSAFISMLYEKTIGNWEKKIKFK